MPIRPNNNRPSGFTLIELVTVVLIVGVLSIAVLPRWFDRGDFEQRGWFDELIQATRYAQKLAVVSHCDVRILITTTGFSLQQPISYCDTDHWQAVSLPGKSPTNVAPTGINVSTGTGDITFYASGHASSTRTVTVTGTSVLRFTVHAATGYVERL